MEYSPWRTLYSRSDSLSLPKLLVKHFFSINDGYSIYLTDLTNIWSERLSRSDIVLRAVAVETSVDPGVGPDQYQILLSKIESALLSSPDSSLTLSRGPKNGNLRLQTLSKLPEPLNALQWTIELEQASTRELTLEFIYPLLAEDNHKTLQTRTLITKLREKDHVISKLIDKLTIAGLDLSTVFPGVVGIKIGKNQPLREAAEKRVPGLGEFLGSEVKDIAEHELDDRLGLPYRDCLFKDQYLHPEEEHFEYKNAWWKSLSLKSSVDLLDFSHSSQHDHLHNHDPSGHDQRGGSQGYEYVAVSIETMLISSY